MYFQSKPILRVLLGNRKVTIASHFMIPGPHDRVTLHYSWTLLNIFNNLSQKQDDNKRAQCNFHSHIHGNIYCGSINRINMLGNHELRIPDDEGRTVIITHL